jgi:single-strand DNA-binding protein
MNAVSITGTLVRDPEMKDRGEHKICEMRLAELGGRKEETPLFVSVSAYGRQAETCSEFLSKGRHVAVAGQLRFREWETDDGNRRSEHSIAADRVEFLPSGGQKGGKGGGGGGRGPGRGGRGGYGGGRGGGSRDDAGGGYEGGDGGF